MFPEGFHFMPGVDGQLFTGSRNTAAGLNRPRWAVITDTLTGGNTFPTFYGWKEQTWVGAVLVDQNGGMFGTPAKNPVVDPNNAQLNVGDNVLLQMAYFDPALDWVFAVVSKGAGATATTGGGGGGIANVILNQAAQQTVPMTLADGAFTAVSWGGDTTQTFFPTTGTKFIVPAGYTNGRFTISARIRFYSDPTVPYPALGIAADYAGILLHNVGTGGNALPDATKPYVRNDAGPCSGNSLIVQDTATFILSTGDLSSFTSPTTTPA